MKKQIVIEDLTNEQLLVYRMVMALKTAIFSYDSSIEDIEIIEETMHKLYNIYAEGDESSKKILEIK